MILKAIKIIPYMLPTLVGGLNTNKNNIQPKKTRETENEDLVLGPFTGTRVNTGEQTNSEAIGWITKQNYNLTYADIQATYQTQVKGYEAQDHFYPISAWSLEIWKIQTKVGYTIANTFATYQTTRPDRFITIGGNTAYRGYAQLANDSTTIESYMSNIGSRLYGRMTEDRNQLFTTIGFNTTTPTTTDTLISLTDVDLWLDMNPEYGVNVNLPLGNPNTTTYLLFYSELYFHSNAVMYNEVPVLIPETQYDNDLWDFYISITMIEDEGLTQEVIDVPNIMFTVLTMPFAFISTAFNLTLFPNTPYSINISNLFLLIIALLVFTLIIKIIIKMIR